MNLTIKNATRIIITRANKWNLGSRLYAVEIRWDYENKFSKFVWNNERYILPSPIANVAGLDPRIVAKACAKAGLVFDCRLENGNVNPRESFYVELWCNDLKENIEEQRRLVAKKKVVETKTIMDASSWSIHDEIEASTKSSEVIETITISKKSNSDDDEDCLF